MQPGNAGTVTVYPPTSGSGSRIMVYFLIIPRSSEMHEQVSLQRFYHKSEGGLEGQGQAPILCKERDGCRLDTGRATTRAHPYYTANRSIRPVYSSGRGGLEVGMELRWQSCPGESN